MQKCRASQSIKTMQLETTIRFHFILVTIVINKTICDNKYWWGAEEKGVLKHHYVNEISEVLIEVSNWGFSKKRTILWYIFIATGHLSKHNTETLEHLCM